MNKDEFAKAMRPRPMGIPMVLAIGLTLAGAILFSEARQHNDGHGLALSIIAGLSCSGGILFARVWGKRALTWRVYDLFRQGRQ